MQRFFWHFLFPFIFTILVILSFSIFLLSFLYLYLLHSTVIMSLLLHKEFPISQFFNFSAQFSACTPATLSNEIHDMNFHEGLYLSLLSLKITNCLDRLRSFLALPLLLTTLPHSNLHLGSL